MQRFSAEAGALIRQNTIADTAAIGII